MNSYLDANHFPSTSDQEANNLQQEVESLLNTDSNGNFFQLFAKYQRILADNSKRDQWPEVHHKLETLFKCGKAEPLDGPMIGIPVSIKDTDYFKDAVEVFGKKRSMIASIEWMATAWNATFADTGLWMGKTFEPVSRETFAEKCNSNQNALSEYTPETTRIGRNFFRVPPDPNVLQGMGIPTLNSLWKLKDRPLSPDASGFDGTLLENNLKKESTIPYSKTGGIFLADSGESVVPELNGKQVYQLNYRWENLQPIFPMTLLVDEIVKIADGVYLGQLVYASKNYNLGTIDLPFVPGEQAITLGERYEPKSVASWWEKLIALLFGKKVPEKVDYGYQNNGYFLMMDPAFATEIYDDDAFPQLRPRKNESGYKELGLDEKIDAVSASVGDDNMDWVNGWKDHAKLREKFTQFITEESPNPNDPDSINDMLEPGESILQMLKRLSENITVQTKYEDHLAHFEKLNQLFRAGVAPKISDGVFQGSGKFGYNTRAESTKTNDWYGEKEITNGFDYYHGATLNLHWGFVETFSPELKDKLDDSMLFPSALASMITDSDHRGPNMMNLVWQGIGKYIFPWAGKSYEKISPRKLSMLLDESADLEERYPARVKQLKTYLASAPHYNLVKKHQENYWGLPGKYAEHLKNGSWDNGMTDEDKAFWENEANNHWVYGNNLQDKRVLSMDAVMRIADMNYRTPDPSIQAVADAGPTPFVRQGYVFLGTSDRTSIMPMNHGDNGTKTVFQFHYRYPMIGGAVPIGFCLDELVEIADGLYLGQLIYSTMLTEPFNSAVDPTKYKYQLFGYFLLMDNDWQRHRLAIQLDNWRDKGKDLHENTLFDIF